MRRRLPLLALLVLGGAYALSSIDLCGDWPALPPELVTVGRGQGPLLAGAARVELSPPYPVTVAGFGPPRPTATSAELPLHARALVLDVGGSLVGFVSVELLTLPSALSEKVTAQLADLGLGQLWIGASHSHSSMGGYDARLVSELAGTGSFDPAAERVVIDASVAAVRQAFKNRQPAELLAGQLDAPDLAVSRSEGPPDWRLTALVVRAQEGVPIGEVLLFSAHPTLRGRNLASLHPDYPGLLSAGREGSDAGVSLFLNGAGGNASSAIGPEDGGMGQLAQALAERIPFIPLKAADTLELAFAQVRVHPPRPDATRLVPTFARAPGDNLLCQSADRSATVGALRLNDLTLLSVPAELSEAAGKELELEAGATRTLTLVNGYLGYVETAERVARHGGESRRQYFGKELLERLAEGAKMAGDAVR